MKFFNVWKMLDLKLILKSVYLFNFCVSFLVMLYLNMELVFYLIKYKLLKCYLNWRILMNCVVFLDFLIGFGNLY